MKTILRNISLKAILLLIALGLWVLVFQNAGIIPTSQNVTVTNEVDAYVKGHMDIDNTVDVNIHAINGYNKVTTSTGTHSVFPYEYMLPVDNW